MDGRDRMTRWLVTRPREEAERFADAMRDRGLDPVVAPILEIEPVDPGPIDLGDVQAVLATSRNGIDAFARRVKRRDLPVLAVGDATAELARSLGFRDVASAAGDGDDLADLARARLDPAAGLLLHPSGEEVARDLPALLAPPASPCGGSCCTAPGRLRRCPRRRWPPWPTPGWRGWCFSLPAPRRSLLPSRLGSN